MIHGQPQNAQNVRVKNAFTDDHMLDLDDVSVVITMDKGTVNVLTIPPNSTTAFPINAQIDVIQKGAGITTITAGAGVTLNGVSTGSAAIDTQYRAVTLIKDATDSWFIMGAHGIVA